VAHARLCDVLVRVHVLRQLLRQVLSKHAELKPIVRKPLPLAERQLTSERLEHGRFARPVWAAKEQAHALGDLETRPRDNVGHAQRVANVGGAQCERCHAAGGWLGQAECGLPLLVNEQRLRGLLQLGQPVELVLPVLGL
jgi:hypothetical protein